MESSSKQSHSLELWLQEVQSYIYKVTSEPMKRANFQFLRSNFSYKRKNKNSQDELSIIFLSQFPVNYRIGFQLEIWHPQIKQVKETFMGDILNKQSYLCSIILFMKDFPSNDPEQKIVKDYPVYNSRDLFLVGDWMAQTLQYELVPLCNQFSTIPHMDSFFEAKPDWSLNTHSGGNLCTDLIVARLNRKRNIHLRYQQLMDGLQLKIENRQMSPESRQLLSLCYDALK
ncbi:MAG TPA: hypothetical protein VK711_16905 [Puia sp.]|jgi:hypothetical protein|nr:hypothetical protein [Puia sp.]